MSHAISTYPLVSDAIGYIYQEDNHEFYVITFPTADVTWCIDLTENNRPHQRLSFDPTMGTYHRHRSNCYVDFQNLRLVGDYQTGEIHHMSRQYFDDAGQLLRCQRRAPHTWKRADRTRVFQSSLQIEFRPGVGTQTGQGVNPQCMLRWSNDGGEVWGNEHWLGIGRAGKYKNRAKKNRLGAPRDRVYEINFSDPTNRDIIGATLWGETESAQE